MDLAKEVLTGNKRAVSRTITLIENKDPVAKEIIDELYPHTGSGKIVGITGPPGVGKSTLVDQMIKGWRKRGKKIAVVAIDPTSPFHGGAILGDRIRMQDNFLDENVFIRSMGTRGAHGGLSEATSEVVNVFDAAGYDIILIETVGAGQAEVDIAKLAHTTTVVVVPGLGDAIQTIKAGMFEIPDIIVVNKADLRGAEEAVMELEMMLDWAPKKAWKPSVLKTMALKNDGIEELLDEIERHWGYLKETGMLYERERERCKEDLIDLVTEKIRESVLEEIKSNGKLDMIVKKITSRKITPYAAADEILAGLEPTK
ncbi:MAG: membrane ATPase/protein kinase [Candidatus Methanolliviera sp. GoM_oil]|nr:MAG: membrane ATPase/protein kinase [Candidatus Methanolliviera sp. GoM_oil]